MPRPARAQWVTRAYARTRHRSWMLSMTLASLGWGTWWIMLFLRRFAPAWMPPLSVAGMVSTTFAVLGLVVAILTLRSRRSWILFAMIPILANSSLLLVPWLASELRRGSL